MQTLHLAFIFICVRGTVDDEMHTLEVNSFQTKKSHSYNGNDDTSMKLQ